MPEPRRRGRAVEDAVLDATLAALGTHGYGFSVDEVARAAGVHKTTVYRRWETKPALVAAAVQRLADLQVPIPATGDTERDVMALAVAVARALRTPAGTRALRAVVAATADDPRLVDTARAFLGGRYEHAAALIRAGQDAGELRGDADPVLVWKAIVNPLHMAAICGDPPADSTARRLTELVLAGARTGTARGAHDVA